MTSTTTTTSYAATGAFYVADGQIIDPNGTPFVASGIDVMEGNEPTAATLLADFPGINFVRLAIYDYADPSALEAYVTELTSAGIVVEIEDHTNSTGSNAGGNSGTIYTGSQLTTELNWYTSIATAFKDNPYVWFGTDNEPSETDASGNLDEAALSTWQQQTYDAIRSTGNTSPIMLEINSYSPASTGEGYTASVYASMTNVVWDLHYYGWLSNYSTDQTTVSQTLTDSVTQAQTIVSADGTVPVIIGEYGNSTTGTSIDANGTQVVTAVQDSGLGSAAWAWSDNGDGDGLINSDGSLTAYGQQVAAGIAAAAAKASTTTATSSTTVTASADDTVLAAGATGSITDASGNSWTLVDGVVDENGAAAGNSSNVTEIAYVNGTVWQENTSNLWWSWTGTAWSAGDGTSTSPLPTTTITPSADDTTVAAGATGSITDASGNSWTLVDGVVDENGAAAGNSANVTQIAYVSGTVWQENASNLWWSWTGTAWSAGDGTSTSPLPATSTSETINVTADGVTQTVTASGTVDDDAFVLAASGAVQATLGATATSIAFTGNAGVTVTGGSAAATVSATDGANTFTSGSGTMDVTGGSGADAYVFLAGSGVLTVMDFAVSKGDTLTIDSSLEGSMTTASDNNGGLMISLGGNAAIDLRNTTTAPTINWS